MGHTKLIWHSVMSAVAGVASVQGPIHAGHAIGHPCGCLGCCGSRWTRGYGTKSAGIHLPHAPAAYGETVVPVLTHLKLLHSPFNNVTGLLPPALDPSKTSYTWRISDEQMGGGCSMSVSIAGGGEMVVEATYLSRAKGLYEILFTASAD